MVLWRCLYFPPVSTMEEPAKKKQRLENSNDGRESFTDIQCFQNSLLAQCLCNIPESSLRKPFTTATVEMADGSFRPIVLSEWEPDQTLEFLSALQLLFDLAIKQNTRGVMCSRVADVCDALARNEHGIIDQIIDLSSTTNKFISFVASRVLASFFIVTKDNIEVAWLERLTQSLVNTHSPSQMVFTLDIVKRVVEHKDCSIHPLEETDSLVPPSSCNTDEPCSLAHLIVRAVKDWRLLDSLPYRHGSGRFGGGSGEGDRPLLQKIVLLVLKSVAVTVKETRSDSSDSSLGSEAEDLDADMAVIERSIREVLRQLDQCVKTLMPFHPEMPLSQWVVQMFHDQDDFLIEGMVCCLDVAVGLFYRGPPQNDLGHMLSPTLTFIQFIHAVSHDPDVLLDLLVSNETCFLLYLLRFLKYIRRNWPEFVSCCGRELDDTMTILIRLRLAIDRLVSKALFPYNINPVLRLLEKCESFYEGNIDN